MRIFFITDLHGEFEALKALPIGKDDLLLIGGDFTQFGSEADLRDALSVIEEIVPNFYAVGGNLDPANSEAIIRDAGHLIPLDSPLDINGIRIIGLGGANHCPRPTPYEWGEDEMAERFAAIDPGHVDIIVTHAPPYGSGADRLPNGLHVGSKSIAEFTQRLQPTYHFCGHIHEAAGKFSLGTTTVFNPGPFGKDGNHTVVEL